MWLNCFDWDWNGMEVSQTILLFSEFQTVCLWFWGNKRTVVLIDTTSAPIEYQSVHASILYQKTDHSSFGEKEMSRETLRNSPSVRPRRKHFGHYCRTLHHHQPMLSEIRSIACEAYSNIFQSGVTATKPANTCELTQCRKVGTGPARLLVWPTTLPCPPFTPFSLNMFEMEREMPWVIWLECVAWHINFWANRFRSFDWIETVKTAGGRLGSMSNYLECIDLPARGSARTLPL